jgi:hypothetical protein
MGVQYMHDEYGCHAELMGACIIIVQGMHIEYW